MCVCWVYIPHLQSNFISKCDSCYKGLKRNKNATKHAAPWREPNKHAEHIAFIKDTLPPFYCFVLFFLFVHKQKDRSEKKEKQNNLSLSLQRLKLRTYGYISTFSIHSTVTPSTFYTTMFTRPFYFSRRGTASDHPRTGSERTGSSPTFVRVDRTDTVERTAYKRQHSDMIAVHISSSLPGMRDKHSYLLNALIHPQPTKLEWTRALS